MELDVAGAEDELAVEHGKSWTESEETPNTGKRRTKRHQCPKPGCGKSFSRPSHLARHALNHSATEFKCSRCKASFKRRDLLERHRARHVSKDRLAGGLGLGVLRTKRFGSGRVAAPNNSLVGEPAALHEPTQRTRMMAVSAHLDEGQHAATSSNSDGILLSRTNPDSTISTASSVGVNQASSGVPEEVTTTGNFNFHSLGDMYHDSSFDLLHFNVTGGLDDIGTLADMSVAPDSAESPVLLLNDFDVAGNHYSLQPPLGALIPEGTIMGTLAPSEPSVPEEHDPTTVGPWARDTSSAYGNSEDVESLCSLGRLRLNNLHLTERKRWDILGLLNDMRPVYPNGTLIDESTAHLSLAQMQEYLDLFLSCFNSCYPMIHSATLEVVDAEPLFLLSMMMLGATYKGKEDHQLSVCIYDAMTPYIMSSLVGMEVPDLSILQTLMILECYGMYRAGAYQRENAILMHTFLFTAIRRLSRYHVRARIMVPDLMTTREQDWRAFAHAEQYKRLILFVFMWDTQNVSYYSFMPCMSTQSVQVNLPCSKELWEAETEATWRTLMASHRDPPMINSIVKDVIEDGGSIWRERLDSLALNLILHGLMSMCNDMVHFNNQSIYLGNVAEGDPGWDPWRRRMSDALELWKTKYDAYAMETRQTIDGDPALHSFREESVAYLALYHTAHIIANADIRHLQIAAGAKAIFGHVVTTSEQEESIQVVLEWVKSSPVSAAHAAWHAAQMIREGLLNLRDWKANGMFHYPWCLYIGTLTCWAFLNFSRDERQLDQVCQHGNGNESDMQMQSKALMHQTISNMASSTPENIGKVLYRCCPHGVAIEIAKYLKTVRWTAAFEAMKVLEGLADLASMQEM